MDEIIAITSEEIAPLGQSEEERQSENEKIEEQINEIKSNELHKNLIIDSEFERLLPKLVDSKYEGLKEDILEHGCRDPVVVWKNHNIILDGHHRYRICTKLGIPFKIVEYEFSNRTAAKIYIFSNQDSKRNLDESELAMLALKLEALYSEQAKERQGTRTDLGQEIDESERGSSAKKAAKVMGISPQTVAYAKRVNKNGVPELKELVKSGKVAVSAASRVADEPPEVQKSVVDEAKTQIQEGKRPNIRAILGKMLSETEDVQEEDSAVSEATEITNLPIDIPEELEEERKKSNEFCDSINVPLEERDALWENKLKRKAEVEGRSSCNPWGGPWICTNCKVGWQQWNIDHPPKHCPGCDDVDSFRKTKLNDLGCKEIVI